jgi:hypothetical protein
MANYDRLRFSNESIHMKGVLLLLCAVPVPRDNASQTIDKDSTLVFGLFTSGRVLFHSASSRQPCLFLH